MIHGVVLCILYLTVTSCRVPSCPAHTCGIETHLRRPPPVCATSPKGAGFPRRSASRLASWGAGSRSAAGGGVRRELGALARPLLGAAEAPPPAARSRRRRVPAPPHPPRPAPSRPRALAPGAGLLRVPGGETARAGRRRTFVAGATPGPDRAPPPPQPPGPGRRRRRRLPPPETFSTSPSSGREVSVAGGLRRRPQAAGGSAVLEPRAREEREGALAAPGPQEAAGWGWGVQGRERRGRGLRGRCTARAARGDGAARPALEGRAEGMERSPGPALLGSEPRAGEGSSGSGAHCGRRAPGPGCGRRADAPGARLAGSRLCVRCSKGRRRQVLAEGR